MGGGVSNDAEGAGQDRDRLWQLYGHAIDEYRFQVNLNWQRLQYFLGLNLAILGVGTGVLRLGTDTQAQPDNTLPALVFVAGVVLSLGSWRLARIQHAYYRTARDQMVALGEQVGAGGHAIATTGGARGEKNRWWLKVRVINEGVLFALAALNGIGAYYAFFR